MGAFPARMTPARSMTDRARLLREEATALQNGRAESAGPDGSGALLALDETVHKLLESDKQTTDDLLRRDRILTGCVSDLSRPGDGGRASAAATSLLGIADRMEVLDGRLGGIGALRLIRGGASALVAMGLAGAALAAASRLLGEPAWFLPGCVAGVAGFAPLLLLAIIGASTQRGAVIERKRLETRALDTLARAHVVVTEDKVPGPDALREHAATIGRRDLLRSLKSRLEKLLLAPEALNDQRGRLQVLTSDIDAEQALQLVAQRSRDPLLAIAGLRHALHDAFARVRDHSREQGRVEGVRQGAAEALMREASHLEDQSKTVVSRQRGGRLRAIRDVAVPAKASPHRTRRPEVARVLRDAQRPTSTLSRRPERVGAPYIMPAPPAPAPTLVFPADPVRVAPLARDGLPTCQREAPTPSLPMPALTMLLADTLPATDASVDREDVDAGDVWPPASLLRGIARRADRDIAPILAVYASVQCD